MTSAVEGFCPQESCKGIFYGLLGILFIMGFIGAGTRVPNILINLRNVEERDKTAAITVSVSLLSLLVFLPAPIFMGYIVDETCTIWSDVSSRPPNAPPMGG